jgi:hypothetical protein
MRFPAKWLASLGGESDKVIATLQHGFARGVEAIYQLEEGEILVESTPARTDRQALLFYEAAEGGAGALSRLMRESGAYPRLAREVLDILHFERESVEQALVKGHKALVDVEDARCVAGCYRCLLSYFNQPDHELIDRRLELVRTFLLRLVRSDVRAPAATARGKPALDGCPPPDAEPLDVGGFQLKWIWRSHRVAAVEADAAPDDLPDRLAAKGIDLVMLPAGDPDRAPVVARLADLLRAGA